MPFLAVALSIFALSLAMVSCMNIIILFHRLSSTRKKYLINVMLVLHVMKLVYLFRCGQVPIVGMARSRCSMIKAMIHCMKSYSESRLLLYC